MPPDRTAPFSLGEKRPGTATPPTSALRSLYSSRPATPSNSSLSSLSASPITASSVESNSPQSSLSAFSTTPSTPTNERFADDNGGLASNSHSPVSGTLWNGSDFPASFYRACNSLKLSRTSLHERSPKSQLLTASPTSPTSVVPPHSRDAHHSDTPRLSSASPPPAPVPAPAPLTPPKTSKGAIELPRRATAAHILSRIAHVRLPASSSEGGAAAESSSAASTPLPARKQHPKASHDLYTPRYVRGGRSAGAKGEQGSKEGWCALCIVEADHVREEDKDERAKAGSWHNLRNSSYRYHLLRIHGVSSKSCTWLEPPINIRPAAAQPVAGHELQGQCHRCRRWITFSDRPPATSWFVHAASCHRLVPLAASDPDSPSQSA